MPPVNLPGSTTVIYLYFLGEISAFSHNSNFYFNLQTLLFSGIGERDGESEMDRYEAILDIISTTFIGPNYQTQLEQAKQVRIEKLERRGKARFPRVE